MFPLPLLPTVPDSLQDMKVHEALLYLNTFMKNALIRALNITYEMAAYAEFSSFMEYVETVCNMLSLHVEGDDVFFDALSEHCSDVTSTNNEDATRLRKDIDSLLGLVGEWIKSPSSYQHTVLQEYLTKMEPNIIEVLHKQMSRFKGDALPRSIDDETLSALVRDNMIWFGSRVDISILLPFCTSHHDPKTSKHWPPVTPDAIEAIPDLAGIHPNIWKFAPFDPVTRNEKAVAF